MIVGEQGGNVAAIRFGEYPGNGQRRTFGL
jgi:hypothetical protein